MSLRDLRQRHCGVAVDTVFVNHHFNTLGSRIETVSEATREMAEAVLPEKPAEAGFALVGGMETWG